ncbi:uncharacterized protein LOC122248272 [Penaeus japonicus]|uniref:uncharacterized protein LOC122248272 n=1 Tax=Penaeus japonicus TaxID=27405 RepID=UPI001C70DC4F|nr:uncharacterized protein LOC122248272 [Penaeus japonicus]
MTVDVEVTDSSITLKVEGEDDVQVDLRKVQQVGKVIETRIWGQAARGVDCGDEAAEWLSRVLFRGHKHVRLLYRGEVLWDRPSLKPRYFEFPQFRPSDRLRRCKSPALTSHSLGIGYLDRIPGVTKTLAPQQESPAQGCALEITTENPQVCVVLCHGGTVERHGDAGLTFDGLVSR